MKTHRGLTVVLAGASGVWMTLSTIASAQDHHAAIDLGTERVVGLRLYDMAPSEEAGGYAVDAATVGTKVPAALRDIPQSVSVVTRQAIDDQNFKTLDQLARRTPGMRVLSNDNGRSSIYARGYEYDAYSVDGLPSPMSSIAGSLPALAAFDRVEIMRGPSGLFNSTSEMGGVVNLVRKRPTETFQGHVTGSVGTLEDYSTGVDISGPIDSAGRVRGRMVTETTQHAQWVDSNDNQQSDFYAALDVDLSDATRLSLGFLHSTKDITVNNGQPTDGDGDLLYTRRSAFYGADWNDFDSEANDVFAELTHRFTDGGYGRLAARYANRNADMNYAFGGSALNVDDELNVAGFGGVTDEQSLALDASYTQVFDAFGNSNEFVVGIDHKAYDTEVEQGRARSLAGTSVGLSELNDLAFVDVLDSAQAGVGGFGYSRYATELEETGLYGKLTVRPVAPLALIAGARVSRFDVSYNDRIDESDASRDETAVTPYAGLVLDLDTNHSLYASYSRVFEPQTGVDENDDLLKSREGEQYEAGIKGSYFGGTLNSRVSAFSLTDRHRGAAPTDPGADYLVDSGEVSITGGEFELSGNLTPQWDMIFGYTYMDTEVKEASTSDGIFLLMPNNIVNLWSQYTFDAGGLDGVHLGAGVSAVSGFSSSADISAPGYAIVDAMLGYDFTSRLSGQLNLYNIFDREVYTRVGSVSTFNFVAQPASAVATLRYDF